MKTLTVALGDRSYPIHIDRNLLGRSDLLRPHIHGRQVLVVSNETVAPLYLERLLQMLDGLELASVNLPDGERFKTLDTLNTIYTALLEKRFNRGCTLIALGGGVVGDITGFAAASYQRGVAFLQVPTTLLAQVDSSVGGKTGVNHALGKNMIGAFHQPRCVLIDTDTLDTLDDRQLSAGLAEVIKYGLIRDAAFFEWLERNMAALRARDKTALASAIERSCTIKAEIVAADEREGGVRALLNLGHTFGHAIETVTGYGNWLHGEAVGAGMAMAADLSARHDWIRRSDAERASALIRAAGLPVAAPPAMTRQQFLECMAVDKKAVDGGLRLVLLEAIGSAVVTAQYRPELLDETLDAAA
jgi:3-dehydroquinate synthase